jgi:hypothetical protein
MYLLTMLIALKLNDDSYVCWSWVLVASTLPSGVSADYIACNRKWILL